MPCLWNGEPVCLSKSRAMLFAMFCVVMQLRNSSAHLAEPGDTGGMIRAVAILETMWDWRGMTSGAGYREAPPFFRINPNNFSGRRLYWWLGQDAKLLVTNACRKLGNGPNDHGKGDPEWLGVNLRRLNEEVADSKPVDLVLICGKVAQDTYDRCGYSMSPARIIRLPHPAARFWNKDALGQTRRIVQESAGNWRIISNANKVAGNEFIFISDQTAEQPARMLMFDPGGGAVLR